MLHSNDLHHLPDAVFRDMKSLQILKLSYNKMSEISSSMTFSGLTSLLRLYLDHNLLQYIHPRAFLQLPGLRLLRLQGNRLHQLHPHTLCTLSLLNTYCFSTLRHLDLSNNSLTTLPKDILVKAPLLETLVLQANPWSCDCRMNWFLRWSLAHPGLMKCPGGPQCPTCASPSSLQNQGLFDQTDLLCTSPVISHPGREPPLEAELNEIQSSETLREPLGTAFLGLSDQQGNSVDLSCNITHSSESQDIVPPTDLSSSSSIPLALSLSLECLVERHSYEKLWRILAYYSETAVRLEREIMLSKAPALAYRYMQTAETNEYYHTGVKASVKARPQWLLQPMISIQLNRAQSNEHKLHLIYSTRVSAHPDPPSYHSVSSPASHPWVLILTNHTTTVLAAVTGSKVELSCSILSSGNPKVQWILPDGSKLISPSSSPNNRLQASASGLLLQKVQLSDAGLYYCVAQAGRDVDILPIRLAVEESSVPPSGEQLGPPIIATDGEPVSLSCKASGSPAPHMSWVLPDGNIIWQGLVISDGLTIHSNGSLFLPNPSLREAGHYRCIALNKYGSDSLSMQLELKPQHLPPLKPFPRRPQSAAGRSTKIRAPLPLEEGSGDEEEEEQTILSGKRKHLRPLQPTPDRRFPVGKPRRRGPVREGQLRRGGGPLFSTDQRRNHFNNRHRATTNKQRIDPQKWADLLAKIRLKTAHTNSNNQPITAGKPTAEPVVRTKDRGTAGHKGADDLDRGRAEGAAVEAETEGSSVDDTVLQEEGLQPIHPVLTETQTHTESKTGTELETAMEKLTEVQTHMEDKIHIQTQNPGSQLDTVTNPETQKEPFTAKPVTGTNEIVPELVEGDEQEPNSNSSRTRSHVSQQGLLPNLVPNLRPQSPWNSRRRIGQRRRITHRPRVRPLIPPRPLPDPKHEPQTVTPGHTTDQMNMLLLTSTTTYPAILLTRNEQIKTAGNGVTWNPLSSPLSNSLGVPSSESASPSLTPSSSSFTSLSLLHTKTHIDTMTHTTDIPDSAVSTLFNILTPAPTWSQAHVTDTHARTHAESIQTHTKPHIALGKHVDTPPSKHSEELERNLSGVPYGSPSTTLFSSHSSIVSSTFPNAATTTSVKTITTPSPILKSTHFTATAGTTISTSTITTSEDTLHPTTTITPITINPITFANSIPTTSTHRSTTTAPTFATPTAPTTTTVPSTKLSTTVFSTITNTSTKSSFKAIPTESNPTTTTTVTTTTPASSTRMTTSAKTFPATTRTVTTITPTPATTMTSTSTTASSKERPIISQVNHQEKPASGDTNQSRPPPDWKNPGANLIPDSHSSRPHSPLLPAVPRAPVVRSRPRIADPHIRTVSFPAGSTARLACEAQGEPKPLITWTKVATGAVMSIHSRAQRFEVLPNGTLVIQNVQLQDRGTYICSAHSYLGRDRLLTTLEVWTRPPRMQLVSYREATIHQGGELLLECQADGVPIPQLSWVLPDRTVLTPAAPSTNRISMDTNGTLHMSVTLPSDRGVYRCVASNSAGAASASVRVHVSSLPPVIQQPREEHLLLSPGRSVYAHCSARGAPPPILRWRIPDGTVVRPSQFLHSNLFVLPNGTLHIRRVEPKNSGSYECTASNAVGGDKRTVTVDIEEGAGGRREEGAGKEEAKYSHSKDRTLSIPSHPSNPLSSPKLPPPSLSDRSRTLSFTPISSSYPQQSNSSNSQPKINKTVTTSPTHFTTINETKLSSPTNNTKVSPSSSFNKSRISSVLLPLPSSPFSKAQIVSSSPSITTVHYGGILKLHCSVTGNPSPIIIWRTPSRKLVDMHFSFDRRLKVHPNGTLSVQAVTEKDAGDYLCIARNKVSDDYRFLRVSVVTKPAKIEPKQPLHQMVSFGRPLKVDCLASGLPDPAVRWSLPDGTMVNSVLQGEDRGGRSRRLTVFDNGTLLVPAVGMGEEGEYTCYAENQGGQDTMKVKVKVMMTTPPTFPDDRSYHVVKVHQGATATIRCQATGDPAPTVMWFSPSHHVIPQKLGFGYYSERVAVLSDGTLEVRLAQKVDTGNYTCRASNSGGARSKVVGLEVEAPNHGPSGQVVERSWGTRNGLSNSRNNIHKVGIIQNGFTNRETSKLDSNNSSNSNNNDGIRHTAPNTSINIDNPALRHDSQKGFNRPVSRITTQLSNSVINVGVSRERNIGIKADNTGINRNGLGTVSSSDSVFISHSRVGGESVEKNTVNNNKSGPGTGLERFNFSKSSGTAASYTGAKNSANTVVDVVTMVKQRAVKGQTIIFQCPSQGSPPPRLAWLLPGNGVLPAPYYGSRLTVHRNGSLELRGVRLSDGGTLVCVVRGERGETRIQVELEVSDPQEDAKALQRTVQKSAGLIESPRSGPSLSPSTTRESLNSQVVLHPRIPLTPRPLQKSLSSPAAPHPLGPPPPSTGPVSKPAVSSRTAPLVSIINGETLRLPCTVPQIVGNIQGSLSWTIPSGKVLSLGESSDLERHRVQKDGTLIVQQASVFDRGTYTCRSSSYDSSSVSVVTVPVIVIAYPPRITKGPSPVTYTRPGVAVELPCLTIATPQATVTWETPDLTQLRVMGQARIYGNHYLSPQGSLVIQKPTSRDTGFYRCTAKNVIGVDTKVTYLHVI
ncbi:matrix-remodeling-associated protein 5-like isoform X2 [Mastacembelus armatus]|nr:matrix-remodeling-associated protein 5-like isoform X2 [Mastacembelus armatus]